MSDIFCRIQVANYEKSVCYCLNPRCFVSLTNIESDTSLWLSLQSLQLQTNFSQHMRFEQQLMNTAPHFVRRKQIVFGLNLRKKHFLQWTRRMKLVQHLPPHCSCFCYLFLASQLPLLGLFLATTSARPRPSFATSRFHFLSFTFLTPPTLTAASRTVVPSSSPSSLLKKTPDRSHSVSEHWLLILCHGNKTTPPLPPHTYDL